MRKLETKNSKSLYLRTKSSPTTNDHILNFCFSHYQIFASACYWHFAQTTTRTFRLEISWHQIVSMTYPNWFFGMDNSSDLKSSSGVPQDSAQLFHIQLWKRFISASNQVHSFKMCYLVIHVAWTSFTAHLSKIFALPPNKSSLLSPFFTWIQCPGGTNSPLQWSDCWRTGQEKQNGQCPATASDVLIHTHHLCQ